MIESLTQGSVVTMVLASGTGFYSAPVSLGLLIAALLCFALMFVVMRLRKK
jgi:predicted PurR-regulated permease PerM